MTPTDLVYKTVVAIVRCFETANYSSGVGYGKIANNTNDPGGLSYGMVQASLNSGSLYLLIQAYVDNKGTEASPLAPFLPQLKARNSQLGIAGVLLDALKRAGNDPIMHQTEDDFFKRNYFDPAVATLNRLNWQTPLALAVIYDSHIQGAWQNLCQQTNTPFSVGEKVWIPKYVATRRNWFERNSNPLLRSCTYRMDTFQHLIATDNWNLNLPIVSHGTLITESGLNVVAPVPTTAPTRIESNDRLLSLENPNLSGDDVQTLKDALRKQGYTVSNSNVFDESVCTAVQAFQALHKMKADGIVGPATRATLGV